MNTVAVGVLLILVLGWAAFLFVAAYVVWRFVGGIGRSVASVFWPRRRGGSCRGLSPARGGRVCPRPQCRRIEYREAQYCSQCGARLVEASKGRRS